MDGPTDVCVNIGGCVNILTEQTNLNQDSPVKSVNSLIENSSDEDEGPVQRIKKRLHQFSDSDVEKENLSSHSCDDKKQSDDEENPISTKNVHRKSRIKLDKSSSESEENDLKNEQQIRQNNKIIKMKQKFHSLLTSRSKSTPMKSNSDGESSDNNENTKSEASDNEMSSIAKIKQKIKKSMTARPSVCDPDTSDEESNVNPKVTPKQRQKKTQKATKMIEAQPMRMSAKQAMENMQLIKSESNRMLREKAVSLPYHRPKALTLKDIMSRRKPAVSSDGKVLPIKMNEEQLKQYALQLEQRQKEMMELCKSESDEETTEKCEDDSNILESNNIGKSEEPESNITDNETVIDEKSADLAYNEMVANVGEKNNDANEEVTEENALEHSEDINSVVALSQMKSVANEDKNDSINTSDLNDSNTDIKLHYKDDSIEENVLNNDEIIIGNKIENIKVVENISSEKLEENSELASQSIHLNYTDSERFDTNDLNSEVKDKVHTKEVNIDDSVKEAFLSDDDIDMADIDLLIESAEIMKDNQVDVSTSDAIDKTKPKIKGAPGMVIDLDGNEPAVLKRSGVELLKEKFTYFSKLKTPEELEREKEKRIKPGAQHLKLKQELEEKIAEQRSLEWAKRLEEEKQNHQEIDAILDDDDEELDDSIDKIKSKEKHIEEQNNDDDSESEEELIENDVEIKDKPRKLNPMLDDEAEESDIDEQETVKDIDVNVDNVDGNVDNDDDNVDTDGEESIDSNDDSSNESSESEGEETTVVRKGRILKAFEDSDDEDIPNEKGDDKIVDNIDDKNEKVDTKEINDLNPNCEMPGSSEDDVIQLAQRAASVSEDLFTSQDSAPNDNIDSITGEGTQSFSISSAKPNEFICPSQPYHDPNLKEIADGFPENIDSQPSQSQPIGEDILALCTGKFYENEFVSQENNELPSQQKVVHNDIQQSEIAQDINTNLIKANTDTISLEEKQPIDNIKEISKEKNNTNLLKSILDELNDPEFDKPKENKYFISGQNKNIEISQVMKKRLIIDSDDEVDTNKIDTGKKKKLKKRKLEDRALQFSDDEEEEDIAEDDDIESDLEDDSEKLVEYDSEENEIIVKPDEPKKKKKTTDFFEQEAELTSEDEWVGSGDEDERGLDRMEREEGDDDVFHQGNLRKELGQIHMRDVLDQDKREVRIIQELLFEDGDLGGGHRQRKFRWRNTEDEEAGTVPDELADTQEEEFESEEQWRKQRHEREVFLRQMQKQDEDETTVNVSVNRTTIIKANLSSKSMSTLLMEVNQTKIDSTTAVVPEKKQVKDLPSPKKMFSILKQNYHGSLLTRGRGALARLAALATPLAVDDDAPNIGSLAPHKRNFVFTALTQDENPPKVSIKRKAEVSTPKLMKKIKTDEKQSRNKNSLLDRINL